MPCCKKKISCFYIFVTISREHFLRIRNDFWKSIGIECCFRDTVPNFELSFERYLGFSRFDSSNTHHLWAILFVKFGNCPWERVNIHINSPLSSPGFRRAFTCQKQTLKLVPWCQSSLANLTARDSNYVFNARQEPSLESLHLSLSALHTTPNFVPLSDHQV